MPDHPAGSQGGLTITTSGCCSCRSPSPTSPSTTTLWCPILRSRAGCRAANPAATDATALTAAFVAHWDQHGYGVFAVRDRTTGRFVGRCGLRYLPKLDAVELLYALRADAWGRGLATEAARAFTYDGLERVGLPTLIGLVLPNKRRLPPSSRERRHDGRDRAHRHLRAAGHSAAPPPGAP